VDKKPFLKILNFIDSYFYEFNNMNDSDGFYDLFNETIFASKYLDIDDFVSFHTGELSYVKFKTLEAQYDEIDHLLRCKIMEVVFNVIYYSNIEIKIKEKIAGFLARYKILFTDETGYRKMILDENIQSLEGSFGKVFLLDDKFVKKQLKPEYWNDNDIASRFKNEYKIQTRMKELGAQVLEVFDYDPINHSFLMQRADVDLADFLSDNIIKFEEKIKLIKQILSVMKLAHENSIIHRDLHVGNILIISGDAYVGDFGFAKDANHLRSKLSTVSPKPTHQFLAPEGFRDFLLLDEISDIYSIGKIIDFIMGNGQLGTKHPFKLLVEHCTKSSREDRYGNMPSLIEAFSSLYENLVNGENINEINMNVTQGVYNLAVENYLVKLVSNNKLASQIVSNSWFDIPNIIQKCDIDNQLKIIKSIYSNYVEATGYGGWENYDIFANISYDIIMGEFDVSIKQIALDILENCAGVRYNAASLLDKIPYDIVEILK
jgi:Serine/threonine protein kinase